MCKDGDQNRKDTSKKSDSDQINSNGNSPYTEALNETKRVIDVQIRMVENSDTETVSLMRLGILALGGIVTLIAYVPELIGNAILWVAVSVLILIFALFFSAFIYRGITLYAGFGDHGYDDHVPRQKLRYEKLINYSDENTGPDAAVPSDRLSSTETFRAELINEHQAGISHNNIEIKYRSQIQQQIILLILIAILGLGVGLVSTIVEGIGKHGTLVVGLTTASIWMAALYIIIKTLGLVGGFIQTNADPSRLSYGYGFKRQYPYLSRICLFTMRHFYNPTDWES